MRYRIYRETILTDHSGGELLNPATDTRLDATPEALAAIAAFEPPCTLKEAAARLGDAVSPEAAEREIARLVETGMILPESPSPSAETVPVPERGPLSEPAQTMFGCPFRSLGEIEPGSFVFVGVPLDIGTTGYPGARYGPDALRGASAERFGYQLDPVTRTMTGWYFAPYGGPILQGARMCDIGNLAFEVGESRGRIYARIAETVSAIYRAGAFPVILGGDHSITYATLPPEPVDLLHIDAHSDLASWDSRHFHHHGNVLTRLFQESRVAAIHHYGLRVTSGADCAQAGSHAHGAPDLAGSGWEQSSLGKTSFISLDIDVLDPAFAPGTGTPAPNGLTPEVLLKVLSRLAITTRPRGFEIVEICPMRDTSGQTERIAVEMILAFLGAYHFGKEKRQDDPAG